MPNFNMNERRKNGKVILDLSGKVIFGEGTFQLHNKIRQLVEQNEKQILLNFAEVSLIDSSGLGELVGGYVAVKKIGGEIKLFNIPRNVYELIELTKLTAVFEIFENENQAVENFGGLTNASVKSVVVNL